MRKLGRKLIKDHLESRKKILILDEILKKAGFFQKLMKILEKRRISLLKLDLISLGVLIALNLDIAVMCILKQFAWNIHHICVMNVKIMNLRMILIITTEFFSSLFQKFIKML